MIFKKILRTFLLFLLCSMLMIGNAIAGFTIGEEREIGEKITLYDQDGI